MLNEMKAWLPGLAFYAIGTIAPALFIVLMTH
jgi:hypothetical protein